MAFHTWPGCDSKQANFQFRFENIPIQIPMQTFSSRILLNPESSTNRDEIIFQLLVSACKYLGFTLETEMGLPQRQKVCTSHAGLGSDALRRQFKKGSIVCLVENRIVVIAGLSRLGAVFVPE